MIQRTALLAVAALTGAATPALAQTAPAPTEQAVSSQVIAPDWVRRPRLEFPQGALQSGVWAGDVVLRCRVGPERRLEACETVSERPAGVGFGAAAMMGLEEGVISEAWLKTHQVGETGLLSVKFRMAQ